VTVEFKNKAPLDFVNGNLPESKPVGSAVLEDCATSVGMTVTVELRNKVPDFINGKLPLEAEKIPAGSVPVRANPED
jgi:hypothetical protein